MRIFILRSFANDYQNIVPANEGDWDIFHRFDGNPIGLPWHPVVMEILRDECQNKDLPAGDFPSLIPHVPCFSRKAVDSLRQLLLPFGEVLSLVCAEGEFYAYNVTRIIDCLDEANSEVVRFDDGGVLNIEKYEFIPKVLENSIIFKIPQTPLMDVFVSEKFISRVEQHGLKGFDFREVWSDE